MISFSHLFDFSPLSSSASRGQTEASDASPSSDTAGKHVLLIKNATLQFARVEVSRVLSIFWIATVTLINDRVKEVGKHIVRLFVSSNHANSLDKGMSRIVDSSLDALIYRPTTGCLFVTEFLVNLQKEMMINQLPYIII